MMDMVFPEPLFFVADCMNILQSGVGPGAYGSDFGAHIEHNHLIISDGFEKLSFHNIRFLKS